MERCDLKGAPMSVLADWPRSRDALHFAHGLDPDHSLISVFRIGKPQGTPRSSHERLPVGELIV